jgi:hypothetical protein
MTGPLNARDIETGAIKELDCVETFPGSGIYILRVASQPADLPDVIANITAVQSNIGLPVAGGTVSIDCSKSSNLMFFCYGAAFSAVNCAFEGSLADSGDTNWFSIQVIRSNANSPETSTGNLSAQPVYAWEASVNALRRARVRCTARASGTQTWHIVQGTYATEPIPASQITGTQPVSLASLPALPAGTNLIGDVGVQYRANATGAATAHKIVSAATTNVGQIKSTAGRVLGWNLANTTAAWKYVKLHNVASATAGAAVAFTIAIPPNGVNVKTIEGGIGFATAISRSIVNGAADTDATAVAVNDVIGSIEFA